MASSSKKTNKFSAPANDDEISNPHTSVTETETPATKATTEKKASGAKEFEKQVLNAIKFDVDALASRFCSDPENLTLFRFEQLFSDMEFPTIFLGRFSNSDLVEFSENLFHYASSYMFGPLSNRMLPDYIESQVNATKMTKMFPVYPEQQQRTHAERIFGIFFVYSLYFMQPSQFVIPVPVTVLQLDDIYEYIGTVLLPDENFEPLYCLYRLINANAFNIYPFEGDFNPFLHRHFDLFNSDPLEFELKQLETLEDFGRIKMIANDPLLKQCEAMHKRYMEAKKQNSDGLPQSLLASKEGPQQLITRALKASTTAFLSVLSMQPSRESNTGNEWQRSEKNGENRNITVKKEREQQRLTFREQEQQQQEKLPSSSSPTIAIISLKRKVMMEEERNFAGTSSGTSRTEDNYHQSSKSPLSDPHQQQDEQHCKLEKQQRQQQQRRGKHQSKEAQHQHETKTPKKRPIRDSSTTNDAATAEESNKKKMEKQFELDQEQEFEREQAESEVLWQRILQAKSATPKKL